jgi:hypothetical protein
MTRAAQDVLAERQRQREVEGWTEAHDDEHDDEELARAAACYATPEWRRDYQRYFDRSENGGRDATWRAPKGWPFDDGFKPTPHDRRRELVKAAALLLAEIERRDRMEARADA